MNTRAHERDQLVSEETKSYHCEREKESDRWRNMLKTAASSLDNSHTVFKHIDNFINQKERKKGNFYIPQTGHKDSQANLSKCLHIIYFNH